MTIIPGKYRAVIRTSAGRGHRTDPHRAAIYARSAGVARATDDIDRQLKAAAGHVRAGGGRVVATFVDRTRAGASPEDRDGFARLLAEAGTGHFGTIVVEDLDRIARDMATLASVIDRLHRLGIVVRQAGRGPVRPGDVTLRGVSSAAHARYRRAMRRRPVRGLRASRRAADPVRP